MLRLTICILLLLIYARANNVVPNNNIVYFALYTVLGWCVGGLVGWSVGWLLCKLACAQAEWCNGAPPQPIFKLTQL